MVVEPTRRTMASPVFLGVLDERSRYLGIHQQAADLLREAMDTWVLVLVCLSPWAFGAVEPEFEFLLYVGVAALLALWAVRMVLEGQLSWQKCPVALCLAALLLSGVWQVT